MQIGWRAICISLIKITCYLGTWFPNHFQYSFSLINLLPVIKKASKYFISTFQIEYFQIFLLYAKPWPDKICDL